METVVSVQKPRAGLLEKPIQMLTVYYKTFRHLFDFKTKTKNKFTIIINLKQ